MWGVETVQGCFFAPLSPLPNAADRIFGISGGAHAPNWFKAGGRRGSRGCFVQHFDHSDYDAKFNMKMMVRRSCMRTNKMLDQVRRVALPYPAPLNNIGQGHEHSGV